MADTDRCVRCDGFVVTELVTREDRMPHPISADLKRRWLVAKEKRTALVHHLIIQQRCINCSATIFLN